jgi:hypothetical protein
MNFGEVSAGMKHLWMRPIDEAFVTAYLKNWEHNN